MADRHFNSVSDIIAFAIRREIEAAEGYAWIADRAATPGLRELADELRRQEEAHRRLLEELTPETLRGLESSFAPDLHIVDTLADERLSGDMSLQDMLIFAAKKEIRAIALYESLARLAGKTGHERVFLFLAGQEREHKLKIEAEYEKQILKEN
ncbi:MAG TPA: ferritin family protein [Acidobacteriota bacterium]|nr:ferritin family protein [Acidobacteriota bacterium]